MILTVTKNAAVAAILLALAATSASAATKPFSEVDTDGDGSMSYHEASPRLQNRGALFSFYIADEDRDGYITKRELKTYNETLVAYIEVRKQIAALSDEEIGKITNTAVGNRYSDFFHPNSAMWRYLVESGEEGPVGLRSKKLKLFTDLRDELDAISSKSESAVAESSVSPTKKAETKDERAARHEAQRQESEKNQNNGQVTASRTEPTTPPAGAEEENQEGSETENSGDQSGESEGAGGESSDSGAPDGSGGPDGGDGGSEGPGGPDGGAGGPGDPDGGIGGEGDFPAG